MSSLNTKPIATRVGLDDAEFLSYKRNKDSILSVQIQAWNASRMTFLFEDTIAVFDHGIGSITSLHEVVGVSAFKEQALKWCYEATMPTDHPFRYYQFLDLDDNPALEIVSGPLIIEYTDVHHADNDFR